mgnify:CR=1 FL=1
MKRLSYLLMAVLFVGSMGLFSSCEDEDAASTLRMTVVEDEGATYEPGTSVTYTIQVTTNKDLESVTATPSKGTSKTFTSDEIEAATTDSVTVLNYAVEIAEDTEGDITVEFSATDEELTVNDSKSFTVVSGPEMTEYTGVTLSYNSTSTSATNQFSLADGTAVADGDFAYCYQGTYGNSIVSPNADWLATLYSYNNIDYSSSTETKISTCGTAWADIDAEFLEGKTVSADEVTGGGYGVQNLSDGDVLVFETADGAKGAIKVSGFSTAKAMGPKVETSADVDVKFIPAPATAK